jgi:HD-like signal output (HDOD) protein
MTQAFAAIDPRPESSLQALEGRLLRELETGRAGLPVLPHIAAAALRFANDPESDLRRLADLVEGDPPIAARLLAVANSPVYARALKVSTTRGAIVRLGLSATRDLLFQVAYANSTMGMARYQDLVRASFRRSVLNGIASRAISERIQLRYEYDYLCGLLHDIGEARIFRILSSLPESLQGVDGARILVARHHCQAGTELAVAWRLPEPIIEACGRHHGDPATASPLVRMVMAADILVDMVEIGEPVDPTADGLAGREPSNPPPHDETVEPCNVTIINAPLAVHEDELEHRLATLEALGLKREISLEVLDKVRQATQFV